MIHPYYFLIAMGLVFFSIGIYAKLTANPKPRKKIVPEPQPRYCTLAEALSKFSQIYNREKDIVVTVKQFNICEQINKMNR